MVKNMEPNQPRIQIAVRVLGVWSRRHGYDLSGVCGAHTLHAASWHSVAVGDQAKRPGPNHLALILTAFAMERSIKLFPRVLRYAQRLARRLQARSSVYKNAVRNIPGIAEDSGLALAQADRLKQQCREASDALMEHWRREHNSVPPGSA